LGPTPKLGEPSRVEQRPEVVAATSSRVGEAAERVERGPGVRRSLEADLLLHRVDVGLETRARATSIERLRRGVDLPRERERLRGPQQRARPQRGVLRRLLVGLRGLLEPVPREEALSQLVAQERLRRARGERVDELVEVGVLLLQLGARVARRLPETGPLPGR